MRHALLLPLFALALCACTHRGEGASVEADTPRDTRTVTAEAGDHAFSPIITAGDFAEQVRILSSDAFGGRGPGSAGEEKTVDYIRSQFARIGLQPGNGGSWFQTVPMLETTADPNTALHLAIGDVRQELAYGRALKTARWCSSATASMRPSAAGTITPTSMSAARPW